jgi:hypothetical protein
MASNRRQQYAASIVRNIRLSTGNSVLEYFRLHPAAGAEEIVGFVEENFDEILGGTFRDLKKQGDTNEGKY